MGQLILNVAMSVNGAFDSPGAEAQGGWLVVDPDSMKAGEDMWQAAAAMILGRKTYEVLSAVWPTLTDVPGFEAYAARMNAMPKYVASRTLTGPLSWNATLLDGDLGDAVRRLTSTHDHDLVVPCAGELAHSLIALDLVDQYWFTVSPYLWASGPRILDTVGPVKLEPTSVTTFPSGVVRLCYRPTRHGEVPLGLAAR